MSENDNFPFYVGLYMLTTYWPAQHVMNRQGITLLI